MPVQDSWEPRKCVRGCGFFGAPWTSEMCSRCWRERDQIYLSVLSAPLSASGETPQMAWSQRSASVHITLHLRGASQLEAGFDAPDKLSLKAVVECKTYAITSLSLFASCVPGRSSVQRSEHRICVTLMKQKRKWWNQLSTDTAFNKFIKPDIQNWQDEDDSDYDDDPVSTHDADIDDDMADSHPRFNMWQWCKNMEQNVGKRPPSAVFDPIDGSQWSSSVPSLPKIPAEFKVAADVICLTAEWLGHSELLRQLQNVEREFQADPTLRNRMADPKNFDALAAAVVQKAFKLDSLEVAKRQSTVVPQVADTLMELPPSTQRPYNTLKELFDIVQEDGKLRLAYALQQLLEHEEPDALVAKLSELADRVPRCNSAKKHAYTMILSHALHCKEQAEQRARGSASCGGIAVDASAARAHLRRCFEDFLDDHKERAFDAAFIEPSRLYFHSIGDTMSLETVRQHGINWYLVLLHAGLGAVLPFLPDYNDMFEVGTADFWLGLDPEAWSSFSDPSAFGKEFQGLPKFRRVQFGSGEFVVDPSLSCEFPQGVQTRHPRNMAMLLIKDTSACARVRRNLAMYVERFAHFFSRNFFLKKALEQLNAEVKPEHAGFRKALAKAFEEFKRETGESTSVATVDEYCYVDQYFSELDVDRVEKLFSWLGFVKHPKAPELCPICCEEKRDVQVLEHWESKGDISNHKMCRECRRNYGKNECPFCKEVLLKDEFLGFIRTFATSVRRSSEDQQRVRTMQEYKAVADRSAQLMEHWQLFEMEHEGNPRLVRRVAKLVIESLASELRQALTSADGADWLRDIAGPVVRLHAMIREAEVAVTTDDAKAFADAVERIIGPFEANPPIDLHCGPWDGHFYGHLYNQVLVAWLCAFRAQVADAELRHCVRRVGNGIARTARWYEARAEKRGLHRFVAEVVHREYITLSHEPVWGAQNQDVVWKSFLEFDSDRNGYVSI